LLAVASLGFLRPGRKSVWASPPNPFAGGIDAKSELRVKERRKLTQARISLFLHPSRKFI